MAKENHRDANKLYNPTVISALIEKYPYIDWVNYINSKLSEGLKFDQNERVIMQNEKYYDQLEAILNRTEKRTLANHILWRELAEYISFLNKDLREMEFDFYKTFSGRSSKLSRWSDCIKSTSGLLNIAVSSMYIREHFKDERIKQDIGDIVAEISKEFEKLLHQNAWMDPLTKKEALKKLDAMGSIIAYPNELLDDEIVEDFFKDLKLSESIFLESAIQIDLHSKKFLCRRFHEPVSRIDWIDHASTIYVNANYQGKSNSIREYLTVFFKTCDNKFFLSQK